MRLVFWIIGGVALAAALYLFFCAGMRVPSRKAARLAQKYLPRASPAKELEQAIVMPVARLLATHIPMKAAKEAQRTRELERAGLNYGAREYLARSIVYCAYMVFGALLLLPLGLGIVTLLLVAVAGLLVYSQQKKPQELFSKHREEVEYELPRFIRTFVHGLKANRDILYLLERYIQTDSAMRREVERLVADVKMSNYEDALERFDRDLDIPALSNFVSALIAQSRGDDQTATFTAIANDMSVMARENLRRQLAKRPGKIKLASIPMVVMVFVLYLYAIAMNLVESFSQIW